MKTLLWGNLIFFSFFLLHFLAWKVKLPARQTKTILIIMFSGLAASLAVFVIFPFLTILGVKAPDTPAEYISVALYVASFVLAYMITYSGIEADSPTLVMMKIIADAREKGIQTEEFFNMLNNDILVKPRLRDLIIDKMVFIREERYILTAKGKIFAEIFILYRKILGLGKGG
ncbi:MAG: hypothetical protein NTX59_05130 [Elusimicrobia bacterium]|nr:hypothetical protein [Elusimicrobiota bacterium]